MAHGTPLATGAGEGRCGVAGPFMLEAGISSSYYVANFFGLTGAAAGPNARERMIIDAEPVAPPLIPEALEGEVLDKKSGDPEHGQAPPPTRLNVGAVITKALKAAGLMKGNGRCGTV